MYYSNRMKLELWVHTNQKIANYELLCGSMQIWGCTCARGCTRRFLNMPLYVRGVGGDNGEGTLKVFRC